MALEDVPRPWRRFLTDLDEELLEPVELHCIGAFVAAVAYGLRRSTEDIDALAVIPATEAARVTTLAGRGSELHRRHRVSLQVVTVASAPADYAERLSELFRGAFRNLRLFALDPYDLALTKLQRNNQRDRDDIRYLAGAVPFDLELLRRRYEEELRPYLGRPDREDLTLNL